MPKKRQNAIWNTIMKPRNLEKAVKKYGYVFLVGRLNVALSKLSYDCGTLQGWQRHDSYVKSINSIQKTMSLLWFYFGG